MNYQPPRRIKKELSKKRLVFTITTGRSGTAFLARMLRVLPQVASYHEPSPEFSDVLREVQRNSEIAYEFWITRKLPSIVSEEDPIYVETSHLFCKGFAIPLLHLGIVPDVIVLKRPDRDVARSMYQLRHVPGRTEIGRKFLLSPDDPGVLPLPQWRGLHDYQLCYWYCLEIERRTKEYSRVFKDKGGRVVESTLDAITTVKGFKRLIKQLDLPRPTFTQWIKYFYMKSQRVNSRVGQKVRAPLPEKKLMSMEQEVLETCMKAGGE